MEILKKKYKSIKERICERKEVGVSTLLVEIILGVIVVAACIIFKDQIIDLVEEMMKEFSVQIKAMY